MKKFNGVKKIAAGFIKSRKAESTVMDFCERMLSKALDDGCEVLFVDVDRGGSRDVDRSQLDVIYQAMGAGIINCLYLRNYKDITEELADLIAFQQFANDNEIEIRIVKVDGDSEEEPEEVWDGGCGC